MKEKSIAQLKTEMLAERVKKLEREWEEENRVIRLLLAAELVSEDKVEQARELARSLK